VVEHQIMLTPPAFFIACQLDGKNDIVDIQYAFAKQFGGHVLLVDDIHRVLTYLDDNGFLQRPAAIGTETPRKYQVTYFGYNGDGHFGRLNLTMSTYLAIGRQDRGVFADDVRPLMVDEHSCTRGVGASSLQQPEV